MTANIDRRYLAVENIETYAPTSAIPLLPAIDAKERPFEEDYAPTRVREIIVPPVGPLGYCMARLPEIPSGPPTKSQFFSCIRTSDSQPFSTVIDSGDLSPFQVRVYPGRDYIDFHADRAGESVTITYKAGMTMFSASLQRQFNAELNAIENAIMDIHAASTVGNNIIPGVAIEDIAAGTFCDVYLSGSTLLLRKATNGEPSGYAPHAIPNGNGGTLVVAGLVSTLGLAGEFREASPTEQAYLLASQKIAGAWTWAGDPDDTYNLDSGQKEVVVGRFYGGGYAFISCNNYPRFVT